MKLNDILGGVNQTRLSEMAFTPAIVNMPQEGGVLDRNHETIQWILKELIHSKSEQGFDTLEDIIRAEIAVQPRAKEYYNSMGDKEQELFWRRVRFIDSL